MNDTATQAYAKAKTWVEANPLPSETAEDIKERTAFHAALDIIGNRLTKDETDAVIALWAHAISAQESLGWNLGWTAAKTAYRAEVAA